ncbi:hypothetical protein PFISCL1PPCAC_5675, partial [Pristionchus fissidentatus]
SEERMQCNGMEGSCRMSPRPTEGNRERKSKMQYTSDDSGEGTSSSFTFYPTTEEIKNFSQMMETIEKETHAGSRCGVIKIVPPEGWKPRKKGYTNNLIGDTKITRPVTETFMSGNKQKCYTKDVTVYKTQLTWSDLQKYAKNKKLSGVRGEKREDIDKLMWECFQKENLPNPVYGADTEGSLYDEGVETLNMAKLGTILDDLKDGASISGVTTTYLYFGMWRTMFPWHAEDVDLYSINYLHYGAPKHWWSIPPEAADMFERLLSQLFPEDALGCEAFLRHKNFIVHPDLLRQYGIAYSTTTQRKNEFVVTFPRGYHMGYNTGLNIAESTNFASHRWIDFAMSCVMCRCKKDAVLIDVRRYVKKYREAEFEKWNKYWTSTEVDLKKADAETRGKQYKLEVPKWRKANIENNLYEERLHNRRRSRCFPHCAVCEVFLPEECCVYKGEVPKSSRRFVTRNLFTKREMSSYDCDESVIDEDERDEVERERGGEGGGEGSSSQDEIFDPKEDRILVCDNCQVSVHEYCYASRRYYDKKGEEEGKEWKCVRCVQKEDIRIRSVTCVLCELRGGAYVRATVGRSPCFVHVSCALAHRGSFFLSPLRKRNQVFITPAPKYMAGYQDLLSLISMPIYRDAVTAADTITNRFQCGICRLPGEGLLSCLECASEPDTEVEIAHLTCAREVGMRIEIRNFPLLITLHCHKHPHTTRVPLEKEVCVDVGNESMMRGKVIGYEEEEAEEGEDEGSSERQ